MYAGGTGMQNLRGELSIDSERKKKKMREKEETSGYCTLERLERGGKYTVFAASARLFVSDYKSFSNSEHLFSFLKGRIFLSSDLSLPSLQRSRLFPPSSLTDCPRHVPEGTVSQLDALVDAPSLSHEFRLVLHQGEHGNLDGRHSRVEPQQGALFSANLAWRSGLQ